MYSDMQCKQTRLTVMLLLFSIIVNPIKMGYVCSCFVVPQNLQPISQTFFIFIKSCLVEYIWLFHNEYIYVHIACIKRGKILKLTKNIHTSSLHLLSLLTMRVKPILRRTL